MAIQKWLEGVSIFFFTLLVPEYIKSVSTPAKDQLLFDLSSVDFKKTILCSALPIFDFIGTVSSSRTTFSRNPQK
jgi:hypothetical protein